MAAEKKFMFERAAFVGVGLIGSSLARAMREEGLAKTIIGYDADTDVLARAKAIGVVDGGAGSLAEAIKGADLVVLSTPVVATAALLPEVAEKADGGALIIDVGSVKGAVAKAAAPVRCGKGSPALPRRSRLFPACSGSAGLGG